MSPSTARLDAIIDGVDGLSVAPRDDGGRVRRLVHQLQGQRVAGQGHLRWRCIPLCACWPHKRSPGKCRENVKLQKNQGRRIQIIPVDNNYKSE